MILRYLAYGLALAGLTGTSTALAQWRCDCTTVIDSCTAQVVVRSSWIEITTDRNECARVDYFVDGQPFVAVTVDGEDRQNWLTQSESPQVLVQSCQVCRDNALSSSAAAADNETTAPQLTDGGEGVLEPLIRVAPAYPASARASGTEGYVELELSVGPQGEVQSPRVTASQPPGVFDQAALAAVVRWRYPADPARETETVTERVEFRLADSAPRPAQPAAAAAPSGAPRNQCVREQVAYNFGEMIEVGLMNACAEPLMVFGCAAGTGAYRGRWVCADSDRAQIALVPPGDARVGQSTQLATSTGTRTYRYADSFYVTRAPNTEYWWIACQTTDDACSDTARQWVRSLDRQLASVDPRGRSQLAVARSY